MTDLFWRLISSRQSTNSAAAPILSCAAPLFKRMMMKAEGACVCVCACTRMCQYACERAKEGELLFAVQQHARRARSV